MRRISCLLPGLIATVVGVLGLGAAPAEGVIIPTKVVVKEIADPTFEYTITMEVDDDCVLSPGNFFTLFDLFGPDGVLVLPDHPPTAPPGWAFTSPAFGPSPFPPSPFDTSIPNVAWVYFGPAIAGPFVIGDFTVTIEQSVPVVPTVHFVSECGPPGATEPFEGDVAVTIVPEPATLGSAACGILLAGACWRRRCRARAA